MSSADLPPLTRKGAERRAAVVDGAVGVIVREGLATLTHRRVATEAGASLAATTYYFTTKDDLLVAALESVIGAEVERVGTEVAEVLISGADRHETALGVATVLGRILAEEPERRVAIFELLLGFARRPDLRPIAEHWLGVYEQLAEQVLVSLDVPNAPSMAKTLIATVHGLMLRQLFAPIDDPATELFAPALAALLTSTDE